MKYKEFLYRISKRYLLLVVFMLFIFSACDEDKILLEEPIDFLSPANAYKSVEGIQQGISALYASVRSQYFLGAGADTEHFRGLGTDVAYHGEDPGGSGYLANYVTVLVPADSWVATYWDDCYTNIQKENNLIEGLTEADVSIFTGEDERMALIAEARFFRAFHYKILTCLYGDVPIVDEVIKSAKTDFVRDPQADVLNVIIADLVYASENLPDPGEEDAPGRVNKAAAFHYLAEAYLWVEDYQKAVDAASAVINNYNYALMTERFGVKLGHDEWGSGDVFFDLFAMGNQNLAENTEAIWVIQNEPLLTGGGMYCGERVHGPAYFRMGNTPDGFQAFLGEFMDGAYTGYDDSLGRGVAGLRPTDYLAYTIWTSDWDNDIRNAKHSIKRHFYFDNPASAYHQQEIKWELYGADLAQRDQIRDTCEFIFPFWTKAGSPNEHYTYLTRSGVGRSHKDIYAARLAETLLLRAEAYLGLNNTSSAADDINKIRRRANATEITAGDVTLDYILDERARELYCEEFRRITLGRLDLLVERTQKYNNNPLIPGNNIQSHHRIWPIPQKELDLDLTGNMTQNPGYL